MFVGGRGSCRTVHMAACDKPSAVNVKDILPKIKQSQAVRCLS